MSETFDVVIAGGGAAGCVLAARLSENRGVRVLLLEAGPDYAVVPTELDDGLGLPVMSSHNWTLTSEPDPNSGRVLGLPRGRVIGGCSTTNAAFALRGHPDDYDSWAAADHLGWGWADVLPSFVRLETDLDFGDAPYHGNDGPIPIHRLRGDERSPLAAALQDAIAATGIPVIDDHNAPGAVGVGPLPINEVGGRRMGVASTYLPSARARPNLTIRGDTLVNKVIVRSGRAQGVQTEGGDVVTAGRVILSAGTYGSPAILLRSGIGPVSDLEALGVAVVAPNEAVGRNLADHPLAPIGLAYAYDTSPGRLMQTVATFHSDGAAAASAPDLQLFGVGPRSTGDSDVWAIAAVLLKPASRGRVWLRSLRPDDPPCISLGYYTDPDDMVRQVCGLRRAVEVIRLPEIRAFTKEVLSAPAGDRDDELEAHIRANVSTYHHPVGTCAMGSVVGPTGEVFDVPGLSVIDASIMPDIPSANTHLPTVMIAEKLATGLV